MDPLDEQHGTIGECLSCQDGREFYQPGSAGIHYLCLVRALVGYCHVSILQTIVLTGLRWTDEGLKPLSP